jgi:hypothetical protein
MRTTPTPPGHLKVGELNLVQTEKTKESIRLAKARADAELRRKANQEQIVLGWKRRGD